MGNIPFMWILAPALAVGVSALYFLRTGHLPLLERALVSAHGAITASLFVLAWGVAFAKREHESFFLPFILLQLLAVASTIYALHRAKVPLVFHILLVGIYPCAFLTLVFGTMAITGVWP